MQTNNNGLKGNVERILDPTCAAIYRDGSGGKLPPKPTVNIPSVLKGDDEQIGGQFLWLILHLYEINSPVLDMVKKGQGSKLQSNGDWCPDNLNPFLKMLQNTAHERGLRFVYVDPISCGEQSLSLPDEVVDVKCLYYINIHGYTGNLNGQPLFPTSGNLWESMANGCIIAIFNPENNDKITTCSNDGAIVPLQSRTLSVGVNSNNDILNEANGNYTLSVAIPPIINPSKMNAR